MNLKRQVGNQTRPYPLNISKDYLIDRHKLTPMVIPPTGVNFKGAEEPRVCSVFGCNVILTPEIQLYGYKCIHHQKIKL